MTNGTKSGPRTYNQQSNENYRNNNFWKKPKESKSKEIFSEDSFIKLRDKSGNKPMNIKAEFILW